MERLRLQAQRKRTQEFLANREQRETALFEQHANKREQAKRLFVRRQINAIWDQKGVSSAKQARRLSKLLDELASLLQKVQIRVLASEARVTGGEKAARQVWEKHRRSRRQARVLEECAKLVGWKASISVIDDNASVTLHEPDAAALSRKYDYLQIVKKRLFPKDRLKRINISSITRLEKDKFEISL